MRPSLEAFTKAVNKYRGNLSKVARSFDVGRTQVRNWMIKDNRFREALDNARMNMFDDCLSTAEFIAKGIPIMDDSGKFVAWQERPDTGMLKYLISRLGRNEGFGDEVTINQGETEGISIEKWIDKELEVKEADKESVSAPAEE